MKRFLWVLLLVTAAPALPAQNPPDSSDEVEAQQLRQQIRERWSQRVRQDLSLSDEQAAKLQATEQKFMQQRIGLAQRQRDINEALRGQLQPGVAANPDSVRRLMDGRDRNRAALAQVERDEDKEVGGYLTPVQHARYQMMRRSASNGGRASRGGGEHHGPARRTRVRPSRRAAGPSRRRRSARVAYSQPQGGVAGAQDRTSGRRVRQQLKHPPVRVGPRNHKRLFAGGAAHADGLFRQRSPGRATRAHTVPRAPVGRRTRAAAQPGHYGPHTRPNREHLQEGTRYGERLPVDLEDGFSGAELQHTVPSPATQGTLRSRPDPGPLF